MLELLVVGTIILISCDILRLARRIRRLNEGIRRNNASFESGVGE